MRALVAMLSVCASLFAQGPVALAQSVKPVAPALPPVQGAIAAHPEWPQAKAADVDSLDHLLGALYDVISGPAGQARDWMRMRSLFVPGARMMVARPVKAGPGRDKTGADVVVFSIDDYIQRSSGGMEAQGFFERGVHDEVAQFGDIAHVFSTYESRHALSDAKPFARGINSIQVLKDRTPNGGTRYWIVDIYWCAESADGALPARYLAQPGTATGGPLNENLTGAWTGQLEYRDFQTNERVFLPTWLTMTPATDGATVRLEYVYDDGPSKTVREESVLAIDAGAKTVMISSTRDKTSETYAVDGLAEFQKLNRGVLTLTGPGKENDKPVDVRITLTLRRNLYTFVKETRAAGAGEYKFRDGYTLTRVAVPGS